MQEIADIVEVSERTVRNHIQSLSYRYPITTFRGGINRGGVYLDKNYLYQGQMLTRDELQVINKALTMLQNSKCDDVSPEIIINLISKFLNLDDIETFKIHEKTKIIAEKFAQ